MDIASLGLGHLSCCPGYGAPSAHQVRGFLSSIGHHAQELSHRFRVTADERKSVASRICGKFQRFRGSKRKSLFWRILSSIPNAGERWGEEAPRPFLPVFFGNWYEWPSESRMRPAVARRPSGLMRGRCAEPGDDNYGLHLSLPHLPAPLPRNREHGLKAIGITNT